MSPPKASEPNEHVRSLTGIGVRDKAERPRAVGGLPVSPRADTGDPFLHPDRRNLSRTRLAFLAAATAVATGVAGFVVATRTGLDGTLALVFGATIAAVLVVTLRSVSVRLTAQVLTLVSAAGMVRFGLLGSRAIGPGSASLVVWMIAVVLVLVISDRLATDSQPELRDASRASGPGPLARAAILVTLAVSLFAVIVGPTVQRHLSPPSAQGEAPDTGPSADGGAAQLRSTNELDMTTRPRLSDRIVLSVDAPRPSFWRGETFDVWDGRRWTRSERDRALLSADGQVAADPDDLGTQGSDVLRQRIRVEAPYADLLYAAPSPVQVDAQQTIEQRSDGSLTSTFQPLGRGATYTVTSRRVPTSPERLRAVTGEDPVSIAEAYAQAPVATDRVTEAARRITAGIDGRYDQIQAIERWMGRRTTYSLDAPLSPEGSDVVDHFLFESRQGWCEQVASSLVVLARLNGIPARLATGFVPGDRDAITGRYTVREKDAHAWAEVWFPDVGWVGFDPTAQVPLAGQDGGESSVVQWLNDHLVQVAAGLLLAALVAVPGVRLAKRLVRRLGRPTPGWATVASDRLERIGQKAGRPRAPAETTTVYGAALGETLDDERLAAVGRVIDDAVFAPDPPTDDDRRLVAATLDAHRSPSRS